MVRHHGAEPSAGIRRLTAFAATAAAGPGRVVVLDERPTASTPRGARLLRHRSPPVPRTALLASDATVALITALPGMVAALVGGLAPLRPAQGRARRADREKLTQLPVPALRHFL